MAKLADLKTLLAAAPKPTRVAKPGASPKRAPAETAPLVHDAASDLDLARAFADVAPLASGNRARRVKTSVSAAPAKRLADEADALAASRRGRDTAVDWDVGQEIESEQTFRRPGLGADLVAKLRRGQWVVQSELDLHGHTSEEAREALATFLAEARSHGLRCVRIIHGKGLSSPNREPILKGRVRRWLTRRDEVLAYCEAPRHRGGSGAVLVLLVGPSA